MSALKTVATTESEKATEVKTKAQGRSQEARHRVLTPTFAGSIPAVPATSKGGCKMKYKKRSVLDARPLLAEAIKGSITNVRKAVMANYISKENEFLQKVLERKATGEVVQEAQRH